jgi:hypothetical protein
MKNFEDLLSLFISAWIGPDLSYSKTRKKYFYQLDNFLFFLKFEKIPMNFVPLQIDIIFGYENILISRLHAECMHSNYSKLRFPTYFHNLGLWHPQKNSPYLKAVRRFRHNSKENYGVLGWSFHSDGDFLVNIPQMVEFASAALAELHVIAKSGDFLQSQHSITDDGNGFYQPPTFYLQLADLALKKDKERLKERLAIISHHNLGTPAVAHAFYSKRLSDM